MKRAAVFLDRDGTINFDSGYISSPDELSIFPVARKGLKLLQDNGFLLFVVTNQSGLARGYFSFHDLGRIHQKLEAELTRDGIRIAEIVYCPHHPDERCRCRKPSPLMVKRLVRKHGLDLKQSFFVGDKIVDILTGRNVGCRTVLISLPEEIDHLRREADWQEPDYVVADLYQAARLISRLAGKSGRSGA